MRRNSGIWCNRVPVATFGKFLGWLIKWKNFRKFVPTKNLWKIKRWSAGIKVVLSYSLSTKFLKILVVWMSSHSSTQSYSCTHQSHSSDQRRSKIRRHSSTRWRSSSRRHSSTQRYESTRKNSSIQKYSSTRTLSSTWNVRVLDRKNLKLPDPTQAKKNILYAHL